MSNPGSSVGFPPVSETRLRFRCLGAAEFFTTKARVGPTAGKKFGALLYLTSEAGRMVARSVLHELVFGELGDNNGRHSLRELIYQLKNIGVPLHAEKDVIGIDCSLVDSDLFDCLSKDRLSDRQIEAISGGFLPGYVPLSSDSYREWFEGYSARSISDLTRVLTRDLERAMDAGEWERGERVARACVAIDPASETATVALADCLALSGSESAALRVLDDFAGDTGRPAASFAVVAKRRRRIKEFSEAYSSTRDLAFVGRSAEMDLLHSYLAQARKGCVSVACLLGDAGIGKTRIAVEFAQRSALEGWTTLRIGIRPTHHGRPLGVFADLIPKMLDMPGALGCAPETLELLARVIGRHETEGGTQASDAEPIANGIVVALCDVLDAISVEGPLLIAIDDIQWMDPASASTLYRIACAGHQFRVFFLLTGRDKTAFAHLEFADEAMKFVLVPPLERDGIRAALNREIPNEDGSFHEWIAGVCGGNPFFLQCMVDEFRRTGERFVVPRKLTELIDHRISQLSPDARHMLATIIRLGSRATPQRIKNATGLAPHDLYVASLQLERARLVRGGGVLEPLHWLIAESEQRLSAGLSTNLIHLSIATVLESELAPPVDPSLLWEISEHWIAAGEGHRAAIPLSKCAVHALDIGHARYASELCLRAAMLAQPHEREALLFRAIRTGAASGQIEVVIRASQLLQTSAARELPIDIEISVILARALAENDQAEGVARLIEAMKSSEHSVQNRSQAAFALLVICDHERQQTLAITLANDIQSLWEELSEVDETSALKLRLVFQSSFGNIDDVPAISRRLLEIADVARCDLAADLERKAGIGFWRAGMVPEARTSFSRAIANAEKAGLILVKAIVAYMMAGMLQDLGEFDESDKWFALADECHRRGGTTAHDFLKVATEAERALARDSHDDVLRIAETGAHLGQNRVSERVKAWSASLNLYARHIRGQSIDVKSAERSIFDGLVPGHESGEMADFQVAILVRILCSERRESDACRVINRYLAEYRRVAMPLTYPLRTLALGLGIPLPAMPSLSG